MTVQTVLKFTRPSIDVAWPDANVIAAGSNVKNLQSHPNFLSVNDELSSDGLVLTRTFSFADATDLESYNNDPERQAWVKIISAYNEEHNITFIKVS